MSSIKCPECGMLNFSTSGSCKRCKVGFSEALVEEAESRKTDAAAYEFWPPRSVSTEKTSEPDWEAFSARLRSGLEEPSAEDPAPHTVLTVFFGTCLMVVTLALLFQIGHYLRLGNDDQWHALTNTNSRLYVPIYEILYWFELTFKCIALVIQIVVLWTFFLKSRKFLRLVSILLAAQFFFVLLDGWGLSVLESTLRAKELGPSVEIALKGMRAELPVYFLSAVLIASWFFYFTTSEKVKKIFIY